MLSCVDWFGQYDVGIDVECCCVSSQVFVSLWCVFEYLIQLCECDVVILCKCNYVVGFVIDCSDCCYGVEFGCMCVQWFEYWFGFVVWWMFDVEMVFGDEVFCIGVVVGVCLVGIVGYWLYGVDGIFCFCDQFV